MANKKLEIVVPEDELAQKLNDACMIIAKIRHYQKIWYEHYGATNKKNLKLWESKADEFLAGLNIEQVDNDAL